MADRNKIQHSFAGVTLNGFTEDGTFLNEMETLI
jgi:hypothetical protein